MSRPDPPTSLVSLTHAAIAVALFGLITTVVPTLSQLLGIPVICGPFTDCNRILADPASRLAGVPVAGFGAGAFIVVLALIAQLWRSSRTAWALLGLTLAMLATSAALQWAVYRRLGLACPWCLGAAAATIMLAVIAGMMLARPRTRQPARLIVWWLGGAVATIFVSAELTLMVRASGADAM